MNRLGPRLIAAVALVVLGWSIGFVQSRLSRTPQLFTLNIDAPMGSTTIRCDGCDLLTWTDGRATARHQVTLDCKGPQPCSETLGGTMAAPRQMAVSGAASERVGR